MQRRYSKALSRGSQSCNEDSLYSVPLFSQIVELSSPISSSRRDTPQFSQSGKESDKPVDFKGSFSSLAFLIDSKESRKSSFQVQDSVAALSSQFDNDFDDFELGKINLGFKVDANQINRKTTEADCESQVSAAKTLQINHYRIPRNLVCPIWKNEKEADSFSEIAFKLSRHEGIEAGGTGVGDSKNKVQNVIGTSKRQGRISKTKMDRVNITTKHAKVKSKRGTRVTKRISS